jgi:hypothetical protein
MKVIMDKQTLIQAEKRGGITAQERLYICRSEKLLEIISMNVYNPILWQLLYSLTSRRASKGLEAYSTRLLAVTAISV